MKATVLMFMQKTSAIFLLIIVFSSIFVLLAYYSQLNYKTCQTSKCLLDALRNNCLNAVHRFSYSTPGAPSMQATSFPTYEVKVERRLSNKGAYCIYSETDDDPTTSPYSATLAMPIEECAYKIDNGYTTIRGYKDADGSCNSYVIRTLNQTE